MNGFILFKGKILEKDLLQENVEKSFKNNIFKISGIF